MDELERKALEYHSAGGVAGKVSVVPTKPCRTAEDLALAYTPGVAKPVLRIEADEEDGLFGLFGFIGYNPNSSLFEGMLDMENGYIKTDDNMHTNIPGVFAAGDIRVKSLRQVVTAAADGAIAAMQAEHYISNH